MSEQIVLAIAMGRSFLLPDPCSRGVSSVSIGVWKCGRLRRLQALCVGAREIMTAGHIFRVAAFLGVRWPLSFLWVLN